MWNSIYKILMTILVAAVVFFYKKSYFDSVINVSSKSIELLYLASYLIITLRFFKQIFFEKIDKKSKDFYILITLYITLTFFGYKAFLTNYPLAVNFPYVAATIINYGILVKYIEKNNK